MAQFIVREKTERRDRKGTTRVKVLGTFDSREEAEELLARSKEWKYPDFMSYDIVNTDSRTVLAETDLDSRERANRIKREELDLRAVELALAKEARALADRPTTIVPGDLSDKMGE